MDRWLARFSFSFFIFAVVLAWEIYKSLIGERGPVPAWRIALYAVAVAVFMSLGAMGVRARHRSIDR
jgi:hypothetical protein